MECSVTVTGATALLGEAKSHMNMENRELHSATYKNMQLNSLPAHFKETVRDHVFFKNLVAFQIKLNVICKCFAYTQNYCNEAIGTEREAERAEGHSLRNRTCLYTLLWGRQRSWLTPVLP